MSYLFLTAGLIAFVFAFRMLGIYPKVKALLARTRAAVAVMRATDLSDREKEHEIQRAAVRIGGSFFDILIRSAASLLAPLACVAVGTASGLYATEEAITAAANPYFLLFLTALAIIQMRLVR